MDTQIKDKIKAKLDELVTATTLGGATESDFRKSPLDQGNFTYPHAYLMPAAVESTVLDNRTIVRTYIFAIMVVEKAENITTNVQIEALREAIMDKFDNNPTLDGVCDAGLPPMASTIEPFQHNNKSFITFDVTLRCHKTKSLTFA